MTWESKYQGILRGKATSKPAVPSISIIKDQSRPVRAGVDDYVFTDREGKPIDQAEFGRYYFQGALRALGIRARKFYNTRHTFINLVLRLELTLNGLRTNVEHLSK